MPSGLYNRIVPVEIRTARPEELDRVHFVIAYAFSGDRTAEGRERMRHVEEMAPATVLAVGGEILACLRVLPLTALIEGAPVALGGVSSVACLPEHRRKGHVGRLLRHALAEMKERGQALSSLYTPHPALYRRYGWMVAGSALKHAWHPKQLRLHAASGPIGRARRAGDDALPALDAVYRRFTEGRTGYLLRSETWWREAVFRRLYDERRTPNDVALWENGAGEPAGYVVYRAARERTLDGSPTDRIFVSEFVALEADAYLGLLRYILAHDLANEIVWYAPPDEPFAVVLEDAGPVRREWHDTFMLRVVDLQSAIAARPAGPGAPEGSFTVHIVDAAAPWNQGTWRIENEGGRLRAERTDEPACLATGAAAFAAMYDGFLKPTEAARCGLAEASDERAAALADRMLATAYRPFSNDPF